jgi:hypothetical protein
MLVSVFAGGGAVSIVDICNLRSTIWGVIFVESVRRHKLKTTVTAGLVSRVCSRLHVWLEHQSTSVYRASGNFALAAYETCREKGYAEHPVERSLLPSARFDKLVPSRRSSRARIEDGQ